MTTSSFGRDHRSSSDGGEDTDEKSHDEHSNDVSIAKGTCLGEWEPYKIVPLYSKHRDGLFDPTDIFAALNDTSASNLPRYKECPIWHPERQQQDDTNIQESVLWKLPELQGFLSKRIRRQFLRNGNEMEQAAVWKVLCLLTTLQLVDDYIRNPTNGGTVPTDTEGSTIPEQTENEEEDDDDDDDDDEMMMTMLMEVWPLLQEFVDWKTFHYIFLQVKHHLYMVTVPHPLTTYAQRTLFELDQKEYQQSSTILSSIETNGKMSTSCNTQLPHRLQASQLWLDVVANQPQRVVGILLQNPLVQSNSEKHNVMPIQQSCIPNTCLELKEHDHSSPPISCRWISLYDLPVKQQSKVSWTLYTRPSPSRCGCFKCTRFDPSRATIGADQIQWAQQLAHSYFQNGDLDQALLLYRKCHDTLARDLANDNDNYETVVPSTNKSLTKSLLHVPIMADLWHSIGAVLLTQLKFTQAQLHWRDGTQYQDHHKEIQEQWIKQDAYRYFDTPTIPTHDPSKIPSYMALPSSISCQSNSQSVFMASNVVDEKTCQHLIQIALDHAATAGGWTTNRHYAVPTQDLPVHKVPKLSEWFQKWMFSTLFPLLCRQFGQANKRNEEDSLDVRFYVHDAFLVRYEATSSNNFLPLHYDESTHSCVVALNDEFDGGGTYVYDLDEIVTPPTGGMVSFRGNKTLHGGSPVTSGIRYILAIFLYLDNDAAVHLSKSGDDIETSCLKRKRDQLGVDTDKNEKNDGFHFSFF
ncbi:hypothetical protein IV203_027318 [Nitzschia inconspicua]|uniref:Fe2OG dioxygenase domain-containing protein n=1 Tax=Nitzschia inconspicua TaxID=303405 RepID=A0A9K3LWI3_9STRA|nr:hypothetical protein IV203_027318 [Nitzschia inconspicua]